jgi:hypothetical protein
VDQEAVRTERRLHDPLAVLHVQPHLPFLTPALAAMLSLRTTQEDAILYCFRAGERVTRATVYLTVHTPATVRDAWQQFLTPPLRSPDVPVFSLADARGVERPGALVRWKLDAELARCGPNDDERDLWLSYDHTLDLLVDAPYLTASVIESAVRSALPQSLPTLAARYAVVGEHTVPPGYADAVARYLSPALQADESPTREEYLRWRALADAVWRDELLPLEDVMAASRLIERPDHAIETEDVDREFDDEVLAGRVDHPGLPDRERRCVVTNEGDAWRPARDDAAWFAAIADPARLARDLAALLPEEARDARFPVATALQWLARHGVSLGIELAPSREG